MINGNATKRKVKLELDLSNYVAEADLNNLTGVDN